MRMMNWWFCAGLCTSCAQMFDLSFRHVLLMYLLRNGVGFPARGWIKPFEGFVYAFLWQNQCKQANDCCYLPLYLCQQKLRGIHELEGFWG